MVVVLVLAGVQNDCMLGIIGGSICGGELLMNLEKRPLYT